MIRRRLSEILGSDEEAERILDIARAHGEY
jgi:hypothetical protein